jgi:hypothetical protein
MKCSSNGEKWAVPRFSLADGKGDLADIDIRHQVYTRFLNRLPLSSTHKGQLAHRGIKDGHRAANYATLGKDRAKAAYSLVEAGLEEHLPRVPGFYVKEREDGNRFWSVTGAGGLGIPVRDVQGRILAVSVRVDENSEGGKYRWLSSKHKGGLGPGAPIHVPLCPKDTDKTSVRITEGALKADVATRLSGMLTIGLPGVSAWRRVTPVLRDLGAKTVRVAYDADACHNRNVAEHLSNLVNHLRRRGFGVELEIWDEAEGKGIDDLLAAAKTPDVVTGDETVDSVVKGIVADAREADPPPKASPTTRPVVNGFHLTDLGNAERLARRHGTDLRHCHPWKRWLHWSERRWQEDQTGAIFARAIDTVRCIYAEAAECEDDNELIPPAIDDLVRRCIADKPRRLKTAAEFRNLLRLALNGHRTLSEVLAAGQLHEVIDVISTMTPSQFSEMKVGQRLLILQKCQDLVVQDDRRLIPARNEFLSVLSRLGIYLNEEEYRKVIGPAVRYGFGTKDAEGKITFDVPMIRGSLIDSAMAVGAPNHRVIVESLLTWLTEIDLDAQKRGFYHIIRPLINALMANQECHDEDALKLARVLQRINDLQRLKLHETDA